MLSLWWSKGLGHTPTDDIFWRSSQSGGRATQRAKSGKDTYGSWGDIAAVNPSGLDLLKLVTIELKRGYDKGTPWELLDAAPTTAQRPFEKALLQAERCAIRAGSVGWMLVHRRDRKRAMAYLSRPVFNLLRNSFAPSGVVRFDLSINVGGKRAPVRMRFVGMPLELFLTVVSPAVISALVSKK
jgi:hypothetical protein